MCALKTKIFYDVINSVKGGSGKSTFSLLLAAYYATKPDTSAYILDLDLCGTSWEPNYSHYLKPIDSSPVQDPSQKRVHYINDFMYDTAITSSQSPFVSFLPRFSDGHDEKATVFLCMSKPGVSKEIDELENELFENAVFHLIDRINSREVSTGQKNVHIIFDMPPGYEVHAKQVVKHLLLDINSPLEKNVLKNSGIYEFCEPYIMNLYMISLLSPAHIKLNLSYVYNLMNGIGYSQNLYQLAEKTAHEGSRRFNLKFIGNDLLHMLPEKGDMSSKDLILSRKKAITQYMIKQMNNKLYEKNVVLKRAMEEMKEHLAEDKPFCILPDMDFSIERKSMLDPSPPDQNLINLPISLTDFEQLIQSDNLS